MILIIYLLQTKKEIDLKDKVHLDEGLNRTLNWINKNYKSLKKKILLHS